MLNDNGLTVGIMAEYRPSLLFRVRSCTGSSHTAEDVIGSEISSFWEVNVGCLHINFFLVDHVLNI